MHSRDHSGPVMERRSHPERVEALDLSASWELMGGLLPVLPRSGVHR
jgi:hypothetical protein